MDSEKFQGAEIQDQIGIRLQKKYRAILGRQLMPADIDTFKALKSASFPAKATAKPSRKRAQPRLWRGWASKHPHLQKMSSYLI